MKSSIEKALSPLLIISSILGLQGIEYPVRRPSLTLIVSVLFMLLRWFIYLCILRFTSTLLDDSGIENVTGAIIFHCNVLSTFVSMVVCMLYEKRFRRCLGRLAAVDNTLEMIGVAKEYSKLYKRTLSIMVVWAIASFYLNVMDSNWAISKHGTLTGLFMCSVLNYAVHANGIIGLSFGVIVGYVGSRLDRVNECVEKLIFDETTDRKWVQEISILSRRRRIDDKESKRIIWVAMHLHWEICSISRELNTVFELQMSFEMGSYFVFLAGLSLYIYHTVSFTDETPFNRIVSLCSLFSWLVSYVGKLFYINRTCENVTSKASVTGDISSKLINSMQDTEMRKDISQIVLHKKCRPLKFSAMGLFDFGDDFIRMFIISLVTVLIIMLQMDVFG